MHFPADRPVCELLKELRGPKDVACAKQENPASLRAKFGVQSESGVENAIHSSDSSVSLFFISSYNQLHKVLA